MPPPDSRLLLVALLALLAIASGVHLGIRLARGILRRRVARTRRVGRRGSRKALTLLEAAGFKVLRTEVTRPGRLEIDGHVHEYVVRADALVARRRRRYVAEFKGGGDVARIAHRRTRRQLLEYVHVFDVEAILLVDAHRGTIHEVRFPPPA